MSTIATQAKLSRKSLRLGLIMVVALMVTGIGAGASLEAKNHPSAPTAIQVDPFQMMIGQKDLATQELTDHSVIFN